MYPMSSYMNIEKKMEKNIMGEFIKLKSGFAFKSKDYTKPGEGTVPIIGSPIFNKVKFILQMPNMF
ncbi:hypothetical protein CK207_20660 (plasmid) [Vibrio anguillarum]|nr:hypothetical protein CK207_20660 [Vibrio anguillarum]